MNFQNLHNSEIWSSFKKKRYELVFNLIAMIIGILLAFRLEGCGTQASMDRSTRTRLHIMYLESEYNVTLGKKMYESYSMTESIIVDLRKLDDFAARAVFDDKNVFHVLDPSQVSLVRGYIHIIKTINAMNEAYISYLGEVGYKNTPSGKVYRKSMKESTASLLATISTVQQQFKVFFEKDKYPQQKIREMNERIERLKEDILKTGKYIKQEP